MFNKSPFVLLLIYLILITATNLKSQNAEWFTLNNGLSTTARAVAVLGNDVYVGGLFSFASGVSANRIAKWNGETWSSLSSGVNGEVAAIAVMGNEVYVGGFFSMAGGVPVNNIAKWDGATWSAVGSGVNEKIMAFAVDGNTLYAGGFFTMAGGNPASRIAKWDGTSWHALGGGINNEVNAIAVSGNNVYAGGYFTNAGGISVTGFAKWDGSNWTSLGSGVNGFVKSIVVIENEIYIGGIFTTVNGVSANRIAKWNGSSWQPLGQGLNGSVLSLLKVNNEIYVGGMFTEAGGIPANRIAKYNIINSTWSSVGSGTSGGIDAMAIYEADNSIVVVGAFGMINNNVTANYVAKFRDNYNPIPVELSSFAANVNGNNVILNWTTASETNNFGFEIQRTSPQPPPSQGGGSTPLAGGGGWEVVGFINGNGTTTEFNNYSFEDNNLLSGKYYYRLNQIDLDGKFEYSNIIEVEIGVPQEFALLQNFPNPFNPSTVISYHLSAISNVVLKVYDILGNEVATLVNDNQTAGKYNINFDANNLSSGIYYYKLFAESFGASGDFVSAKKMILIK